MAQTRPNTLSISDPRMQFTAPYDPAVLPPPPRFPLSTKHLWLTALSTGAIAAVFQTLIAAALRVSLSIGEASWNEFHQALPPNFAYQVLTLGGLIESGIWIFVFGVAFAFSLASAISIRVLHQSGMGTLILTDHVVASHVVALICVAPVFTIALHFPSLHPELQSIGGAIVAAAYVGIIGASTIYTHFPLLWLLAYLRTRAARRREATAA